MHTLVLAKCVHLLVVCSTGTANPPQPRIGCQLRLAFYWFGMHLFTDNQQ